MRSLKIKFLGATAFAVLASLVVGAETVPAVVAGKVVDADIEHLGKLVELAKTKKVGGRVKVTAAMLALTANENVGGKNGAKMGAIRDVAIKIAEAAAKKDAKAVEAGVKSLAKPEGGDTKPMKTEDILKASKVDLEELMSIFGKSTAGGMNLEADIRDLKKGTKGAKEGEVIGGRSAILAELTAAMPGSKVQSEADKKDWAKYSKEMLDYSQQLATESAKGAKADAAKLKTVGGKLDASCTNCHNKFRD